MTQHSEIAYLQVQPEREAEPSIDLAKIYEMISSTGLVWSKFRDRGKQASARILFEDVIIDLDAQTITRVTITSLADTLFETPILDRPDDQNWAGGSAKSHVEAKRM